MAVPKELPLLRNWQDFEDLCRDLWSEIWDDPQTKLHGRSGQRDQGVDVYGSPGGGEAWHGVQCKKKSWGQRLEEREIRNEVAAALAFEPKLSHLVFATTAPRDRKAQKVAREITATHKEQGLFTVEIADWQEIAERILREHPDLRDRYFGDSVVRILGTELELARQAYLQDLWSRLTPLPVTAMGFGDSHRPVPLLEVYTALDVEAALEIRTAPAEHLEDREPFGTLANTEALVVTLKASRAYLEAHADWEDLATARKAEQQNRLRGSTTRPLAVIESVAASPRLVLTGEGGSGKSTFARHLVLCHAGEWLLRKEANLRRLERGDLEEKGRPATWPHGPRLPLFVELRHLVASQVFPKPGEAGEATHLLTFLKAEAKSHKVKGFGKLLRALLDAKGTGLLLVLDGLDETPEGEKARERLRDVILSWADTYPECRILVTSRPYAYRQKSPWRLEGFGEAALAELADGQIQSFLRGWYDSAARHGQLDRTLARPRAERLWREFRAPYLRRLAGRPLMLTMMANLHARGSGRLPHGGRAGVYQKSVELLLDQWNEGRGLLAEEGNVADYLGIDTEKLTEVLEDLAFKAHGRQEVSDEKGAEISAAQLWKKLCKVRKSAAESQVDDLRVRDYLAQRSGILIEERTGLYRFPHRSFQEYLAACHLCRDRTFPAKTLAALETHPELWREVTTFLGGRLAEPPFLGFWALLGGLLPPELPSRHPELPNWERILYAALAVQESGLWREEDFLDDERLQSLRAWLAVLLCIGCLPVADRGRAGRILGRIGDGREGVGEKNGIPDIDWVPIPAGSFRFGDRKESRTLKYAFEISRYPVTNAQYQPFVEAGGYGEDGSRFWSRMGLHWREAGKVEGPQPLSDPFNLPNHPRVEVSWWEAEAYCTWLHAATGQQVRLATEVEWERAARGRGGRVYPWGDVWQGGWCNSRRGGLHTISAVGVFPQDCSPEGVLDLAGNVREWCLPEEGLSRMFRGGSWGFAQQGCRAAFRLWLDPGARLEYLGFRLVRT